MGLAISLGLLAEMVVDEDAEGIEWFDKEMATVNRVLRENGQREHVEPRLLPDLLSRAPINGYPYSFMHFLRRVAALRRSNPEFVATPLADGQEPDDPAVEREYAEIRSHLICHSDAEGFYVPIDFSEVLFDESKNELTGAMLGSSQQLLRELVLAADEASYITGAEINIDGGILAGAAGSPSR